MLLSERPFQIALLLSLLAFLAVRAYYRQKTGTLRLDFSRSQDSRMMRLFLVVLSMPALAMLAWLINPDWMWWSAVALAEGVRWIGAGMVVVGLALLIWSHQTLDTSFSGNLEVREQHKLVTTGPYHWIRHPIYSAILLWSAGLALITASWVVGLIPVAFTVFFMARVPNEERMMMEAFGDAYRANMKQTGRFLPRVPD
ncbi:MAG TPA: isoprenylcysteine carboxylmethyltransferase family protein [Bellilinea sp.]|nr:isoprenylcysteine carboxylmethyltransferase family protein [Bellilinea sp.]